MKQGDERSAISEQVFVSSAGMSAVPIRLNQHDMSCFIIIIIIKIIVAKCLVGPG